MSEYIFFNEDWNRETDYCYKHGITKDKDGQCYKCLEEKKEAKKSRRWRVLTRKRISW